MFTSPIRSILSSSSSGDLRQVISISELTLLQHHHSPEDDEDGVRCTRRLCTIQAPSCAAPSVNVNSRSVVVIGENSCPAF